MSLPDNPVPPHRMNCKYGLAKELRAKEPIATEMNHYKSYLSEPLQMDRDGKAAAPRTLENICSHIFLFLGFLVVHKRIARPSLRAYIDINAFAEYIAFQMAKGNTFTTISHQIATARKTLAYLASRGSQQLYREVQAATGWLTKLNNQLSTMLPKPRMDVGELQADNKWAEAEEIVARFDTVRQHALSAVPEDDQGCTVAEARLLHDASLSNLMFGYMAPLRLVSLRTLQLPASIGCLYPGCTRRECQGNRLIWKDGHMEISMRHYKVDEK